MAIGCYAQGIDNPVPSKLSLTNSVPANLLALRSCVFYSSSCTNQQLETIQKSFQKTGIDAVAYFKTPFVFAGDDISQKVAEYLIKREIAFIILVDKNENVFSFIFTPFNNTKDFVNNGQSGWEIANMSLNEGLQTIYRTTVNNQPVKNFLINSYPERDFPISIIEGRRSDFYAIDLKVDKLAVPWFKDAAKDSTMAQFFRDNYPFNYGMVEPGLDKKELRSKGFHYLLSYLHTEGVIAKEILGYPNATGESAITSVTYPNGSLQLKTLPAETPVYKFYLKHLESGNVFLGTKWDGDITWQDALRNQIKGFKAELKIP
jgi:hypothetical protein